MPAGKTAWESEAYSEPSPTTKTELFEKIVNDS